LSTGFGGRGAAVTAVTAVPHAVQNAISGPTHDPQIGQACPAGASTGAGAASSSAWPHCMQKR
jgi:hypothetical protein